MNPEAEAKQAFDKTDQMIEYREGKLKDSNINPWTRKQVQLELNVLQFLKLHAAKALEDQGISIEQRT